MPIPALSKQVAIVMVQTLGQAFAATANPDGTTTAHWTDDAAYARTLLIRGAWSQDATTYPQLAVQARLPGKPLTGCGGIVGVTTANGLLVAKRGGVFDRAEVHCWLRAQSEDEREQLGDQVRSTIDGGQNANAVPWRHVLKTTGFEPLWWGEDRLFQERQADDPGHGPVVYGNDLILYARAEYVYVPAVQGILSAVLKATLVVGPGQKPLWTF